jgi:hypothetical protein
MLQTLANGSLGAREGHNYVGLDEWTFLYRAVLDESGQIPFATLPNASELGEIMDVVSIWNSIVETLGLRVPIAQLRLASLEGALHYLEASEASGWSPSRFAVGDAESEFLSLLTEVATIYKEMAVDTSREYQFSRWFEQSFVLQLNSDLIGPTLDSALETYLEATSLARLARTDEAAPEVDKGDRRDLVLNAVVARQNLDSAPTWLQGYTRVADAIDSTARFRIRSIDRPAPEGVATAAGGAPEPASGLSPNRLLVHLSEIVEDHDLAEIRGALEGSIRASSDLDSYGIGVVQQLREALAKLKS